MVPTASAAGWPPATAAPTTTTREAAGEHRDRAEPVGEPAADRAHDARRRTTKPAIRLAASAWVEAVGGLEVGGQVDRERDVAAERDGVEEARLPGDRQPRRRREPASPATSVGHGPAGGVAQDQPGDDARRRASTTAVIRNGVAGAACA